MSEGAETETSSAVLAAAPATTPFSFAVSRDPSGVLVSLFGELDQPHVERLTSVLRDLIDDQGNWVVTVDFRHVCGVDSSALDLFSSASEWAGRHGTSFRLHGPPPGFEVPGLAWRSHEVTIPTA